MSSPYRWHSSYTHQGLERDFLVLPHFSILSLSSNNVSNNSQTWKFRALHNTTACAIYTIQCFSGSCNVAILWITDRKWWCVLPDVLCLSQLVNMWWLRSDVKFVSKIYLKSIIHEYVYYENGLLSCYWLQRWIGYK